MKTTFTIAAELKCPHCGLALSEYWYDEEQDPRLLRHPKTYETGEDRDSVPSRCKIAGRYFEKPTVELKEVRR